MHLEFIQGVINRMARNSFLLKGWAVTLVSALVALSPGDAFKGDVIVSYLPLIGFWILDAYFVRQERLFSKLYDAVRLQREGAIDYSMDTRPYEREVDSWLKVALSPKPIAKALPCLSLWPGVLDRPACTYRSARAMIQGRPSSQKTRTASPNRRVKWASVIHSALGPAPRTSPARNNRTWLISGMSSSG